MTNNISLYASSLCSQLWKRNCKFFSLISTSEDSGNHAIEVTFRFDSDCLNPLLRRTQSFTLYGDYKPRTISSRLPLCLEFGKD